MELEMPLNPPDRKKVYSCLYCDEPIYDGDTFATDGFTRLCEGCMDNMSRTDLLKFFDVDIEVADEYEAFKEAMDI